MHKTWAAYKAGFSDALGNFWIGNDNLHRLTKDGQCTAHFDGWVSDSDNEWLWAEYLQFSISNEATSYILGYKAYIGGSLPIDGLLLSRGCSFSTFDRGSLTVCAITVRGGFWYSGCARTCMTGYGITLRICGEFCYILKFTRITLLCG